ncbi:exosortase-dependent surface protein XDP1 [Alteromonas ponticola]|uniref:PEP-CTERM sorting domain-containing protein n=1 Tax=Alteromonas ponticola TaxID=2720613 RepID=A0ABX1QXC3_9ALTE|nr:exosortase-dependent surface protein XDP1 [Alteromonas ponticola]NMH58892.1 PEP-CTERM sorting domain-containing protein [Alteromonas ponticola]
MKSGKLALVLCSLCFGQAVFAEDTTWNFADVADTGNYYGNQINVSQSGQNLTVSAWADSGVTWGNDGYGRLNGTIESARVDANSWGLLNYNRLHDYYHDGKKADGHMIDNSLGTDMLLFSFDEAVSVTNLNLGWAQDSNKRGYSDISIAAFSELPSLNGSNWSDVVNSTTLTFSSTFANVSTGGYDLSSIATEARYWLIGAYNSVFGTADKAGKGNDGFKLLALTTHAKQPTSDVPAPATGALMAAVCALVIYRRRKQ